MVRRAASSGLVPSESLSWLVPVNQFNYRYMWHDLFSGSLSQSLTVNDVRFPGEATVLDPTIKNRAVPTAGSTYFAYSSGFQIGLEELVKLSLTDEAPPISTRKLR